MLEKYLHHHVGCECLVDGFDDPVKLTGVSYDDTEKVWWAYFENTEIGHAPYSKVKPLLRPFTDMQRDELIEYFKLPDNIEILRMNKRKGLIEWEFRRVHPNPKLNNADGFSYSSIGMDVTVFKGMSGAMIYIFAKDFDVLGLIEQGLAVDKTKYKKVA